VKGILEDNVNPLIAYLPRSILEKAMDNGISICGFVPGLSLTENIKTLSTCAYDLRV